MARIEKISVKSYRVLQNIFIESQACLGDLWSEGYFRELP